tara:strand:- start:467 stop:1711 length:1245 start_codon:yes stop_codon:yes gene_type:complete
MDIIQFLDRSAFTDSLSRFDLVQKAIHEGIKWNKFRGKTSFRAKVLTMPIRLAGVDTTPLVGEAEGGQVAKKGNKIAFKGRILGDPSPHDWLIDPCDLDATNDPGLVLRMTALHTTFESANDIVVSEATMPKMGDIVNIELTPNVFWYNLSFGKFTSIANQAAPGSEGPAESAGAACDSLESFFENIDYEDLKGGGSSFEYSVGGAGGAYSPVSGVAGAKYYRFPKSLDVLDPKAKPKFEAFFKELKSSGYTVNINSARRSVKHQWVLYAGGGGMQAAKPCHSNHQYGFAMDLSFTVPASYGVVDINDHSNRLCTGKTKCTNLTSDQQTKHKAAYAAIVKIASSHSIDWYGTSHTWSSDPVHFSTPGRPSISACQKYYYKKYGGLYDSDPKKWPSDFEDVLWPITTGVKPGTGS